MSNDRRLRRGGGENSIRWNGVGGGLASGLEIVQMNFRPLAYFVCISVLLGKELSLSISLSFYLSLHIYVSIWSPPSPRQTISLLPVDILELNAPKNMLYFIFDNIIL